MPPGWNSRKMILRTPPPLRPRGRPAASNSNSKQQRDNQQVVPQRYSSSLAIMPGDSETAKPEKVSACVAVSGLFPPQNKVKVASGWSQAAVDRDPLLQRVCIAHRATNSAAGHSKKPWFYTQHALDVGLNPPWLATLRFNHYFSLNSHVFPTSSHVTGQRDREEAEPVPAAVVAGTADIPAPAAKKLKVSGLVGIGGAVTNRSVSLLFVTTHV